MPRRPVASRPLVSPLTYDLKQITSSYLNSGVAPKNIVLALPWYGRQWPTVTNDVNAQVQPDRTLFDRPYNVSYAEAVSGRPAVRPLFRCWRDVCLHGVPDDGRTRLPDDVDRRSTTTMSTRLARSSISRSQGLAGVGIFALGYDDTQPELWKELRVKYRGLVDTTAPTGAVVLDPAERLCQVATAAVDLSASDGTAGSGAVFVRLSNESTVDERRDAGQRADVSGHGEGELAARRSRAGWLGRLGTAPGLCPVA